MDGPTTLLLGIAWAVQGAGLVLALLAAVRRRDLWPFSHYPMFAGRTNARAVRFFVVRFRLRDGGERGLDGLADALADRFHRRCEGCWPEAGAPDLPAARVALRALWREARALEPALSEARSVVIEQRTASLGPDGVIRQDEAVVLRHDLGPEEEHA